MPANRLPVSSPTEVAAEIKARILAGDFAPGQRLIEADLIESLQASRGAVRSALINLTHEGLVERIAHRGARVRTVSLDEAVQITEVRMVIEGLCCAHAARKITDPEIESLRAIGTEMESCVASGDVIGYSECNQRLHDTIIKVADQGIATETISRLRARNVRHQFRLAYRPGRPTVSLPQHLAIITAICDHDPARAEAAGRAHLASVIEALREAAEQDGRATAR